MISDFAISGQINRNDQKFFSTQEHITRMVGSLWNRPCTCWRGNTRAVTACQTCRQWSIALMRFDEL